MDKGEGYFGHLTKIPNFHLHRHHNHHYRLRKKKVEKGRIERSSKKEGAERLRRRDKLKVSYFVIDFVGDINGVVEISLLLLLGCCWDVVGDD
ncbi:hypothetical protein Sjap_021872 [Stephania japonica]|uniref:Uncharacterized protein n=1 Tax=Stephania japonica TaxID=461633 RepID=A0AAP0HUI4_9MAGN